MHDGKPRSPARPVQFVRIASTPTGQGYWMVASDGGVFTFGDARFLGATASATPIIGMVATADGGGYGLVNAAGAAFRFGDSAL